MGNRKVYDHWHEQHAEEKRAGELAPWHFSALEAMGDVRGKKILEVGCGRGQFSMELARQGAHVTAVDFSDAAIRLAKQDAELSGRQVTFVVADAQDLPFEDQTFDFVISCECLEHVPEPKRMLAQCARVLKSEGTLVLTTENYTNGMVLLWLKTWLFRKPFNSGGMPQPIEHFFVFWHVMHLIRRAGLRMSHFFGTYHVFLVLPRCRPDQFVIDRFKNPLLQRLFKPLARHVTFVAVKPAD